MSDSRIPRILELAPNFEAKSTHGSIRLSDYTSKGKWVMLFSKHPSDFTPVCSTEFIEFARRQGRLGPAERSTHRGFDRLAAVAHRVGARP